MVDSVPMRFLPFGVAILAAVASLTAAGCGDTRPSDSKPKAAATAKPGGAPAATAPAARPWELKPIVVPPDPAPAARLAADSLGSDSIGAREPIAPQLALGQKAALCAHSGRLGALARQGPGSAARLAPAGSPHHRLLRQSPVQAHGHPRAAAADEMLPRLERTATEWARAEPARKVMPALHLIATVAQGKPGAGGKYRLRHSDQLIEQVLGWAEERGWLVFLDVQIGHSTVRRRAAPPGEVSRAAVRPPRARSRVRHEAGRRARPADRHARRTEDRTRRSSLLVEHRGPQEGCRPRSCVVHRFTQRMLTKATGSGSIRGCRW